jgi:hypothetical protein
MRVSSKVTCSLSAMLAACTKPPSSWFSRPSGSITCPESAAITARASRIAKVARSTSTSTKTAA